MLDRVIRGSILLYNKLVQHINYNSVSKCQIKYTYVIYESYSHKSIDLLNKEVKRLFSYENL